PQRVRVWAVGAAIQVLLIVAVILAGGSGGLDTQLLNGTVTAKYREKVSCEHSYQVCSGSGNNQTCTTFYDHPYDFDWVVESEVGSTRIERVDRQGKTEPLRWSRVQIGEPFTAEELYYNFSKASSTTLFGKKADTEFDYPEVFDYYRVNRVVKYSGNYNPEPALNEALNKYNAALGPTKRVNIVVVFYGGDSSVAHRIQRAMLGGKINDVTVAVNAQHDGTVNHVHVYSWSQDPLVNVAIRDSILDLGIIESEKMAALIADNVRKHYVHRPIAEFEYLREDADLPWWALVLLFVVGLTWPVAWVFITYRRGY